MTFCRSLKKMQALLIKKGLKYRVYPQDSL
jgi:hypothetical protein